MSNTRIIAEIQTQADTRQLERAAKLFDEFSDAVKNGGKDAGIAYKATLSSVDKLILKQAQLKKALINERDTAKIDKYSKALVGVEQRLNVIAQKSAKVSKTQSGGGGSNGTAALLGGLGGGISGAFGVIGGAVGGGIGGAVGQQIGAATEAIVEFGKESLNAYAQFVSLQTQIETFATGDAKALQSALQQFATENPIANYADSVQGAVSLLREGFTDKEAFNALKQITEVAGGSKQSFDGIVLALSQVKSAGKLMGQELNQLRNAGFNPLIELQKTAKFAGKDLRKEMEKGNITFQDVSDALKAATSEGGRFFGQSEKLAKTYEGSLANLEDATTNLKTAFGKLLAENGVTDFNIGLTNIIRAITLFIQSDTFNSFLDGFDRWGKLLRALPIFQSAFAIKDLFKSISDASSEFVEKEAAKQKEAQEKAAKRSEAFVIRLQKAGKLPQGDPTQFLNVQGVLMEGEELKNAIDSAEKKVTQISAEAQKKREEAQRKHAENVKETNSELEKSLLQAEKKKQALQDRLELQALGLTASDIKKKYAIELAAELREIEANKQAIDKEIVVYDSEQAAKKIQLLQSFESEKTAITELYRINEAKDTKEHNEELAKAEKELKERILQLRRENIEGTFELVRQNFDNEAEILRIRESLAIESINKQFDAEKEAINEKVKLGLDATNLLLELENQRQGALTISEKRFNKERLELNDKYFNEYLSKLQEFTQRAQLVQENDFSRERIALQEQYNNGLIGRSKYYKELEILDKEQELKRAKYNLTGLVQESVAIQGEILDGNLSADEKEALKKRREQLKVEIEKAGLEVSQIQANQGTEVITKQQEQLQAAADFGVQIAQLAADSMGAILQAQIDAIDNTIAVQEDRLQNARSLAEAGFTANLQQEQDKLELLQQKREAFVRRQVIIDNIARISAQALALANAIAGASTTGPAAPFTIAAAAASVLATIATSVAQARSFNTGTAWLTPANGTQGRRVDDIPIMANKGEGIIPTAQNERFNAITKAMIEGNPKSIALAALQYPSIKKHLLPDYSFALSKAPYQQANQAQTIVEMRKHIDRLEQLIGGITIVNNNAQLNFDADGASKYMTKKQQRLADIRNKTK